MKEHYEKIKEFMLRAGQECPLQLKVPSEEVQQLRLKLHLEEAVKELKDAFGGRELHEILDSVCDSLVVVFGTAVACGMTYKQVEAGLQEVMRSNLTKFIDGHKQADGKWIKGPSYSPANLMKVLYTRIDYTIDPEDWERLWRAYAPTLFDSSKTDNKV